MVSENATTQGTRVSTQVLASAVARTGVDRAEIVLFIDQSRTNKSQPEPAVFRNQVILTMERQGTSGSWTAPCTHMDEC